MFTAERAFAAKPITVAEVGDTPGATIRKAFYDPFEKETGIKVVGVAHGSDPTIQFRLLVETHSSIWDACMVMPSNVTTLSKLKDYLDKPNISPVAGSDLVPGMVTSNWLGLSVFGSTLAYRTDRFPGSGPRSWANYWDVAKFPGLRGLYCGRQRRVGSGADGRWCCGTT